MSADLPIAAQLYTVRQFTQTPAGLADALRRLKAIGYPAVQLSGTAPIPPADLRRILDTEGLACCATHESFDTLRDEPEMVLEKHRALGCRHTAIGSIPEPYRTREGYPRFAGEFSEIAASLKERGLEVGYHNHHFEFQRFDGKTALQILVDQCDPAVFFEIDTYWVQAGGADPAQWLRSLAGRAPVVHLKDMTFGHDDTGAAALERRPGDTDDADHARRNHARGPKPVMAEVGEGNLNWPAILDACQHAGVLWHVVEQDTCQRDPFESLAISLQNLQRLWTSP